MSDIDHKNKSTSTKKYVPPKRRLWQYEDDSFNDNKLKQTEDSSQEKNTASHDISEKSAYCASGAQLEILCLILDMTEKDQEKITHPLSSSFISRSLNIKQETTRTAIKQLQKKGIIYAIREPHKKYPRFKINKEIRIELTKIRGRSKEENEL